MNHSTRDRLMVHGLEFLGYHGVYDEERRDGNRFSVDVLVELDTHKAGDSDTLGDTIDYRGLAQVVMDVGQGPSHHLIESLVDRMAELILARFDVSAVELTLRKFASGVPGDPAWVGIKIRRERGAHP